MRVGIFGHYGNRNLGDEAITEAAINSARDILQAEEIVLYSIVPSDSAFRHNLDAYPIRRGQQPASAGTPFHHPERRRAKASESITEEPPTNESSLRRFLKRSTLVRNSVNSLRTIISFPGRFIAEISFLHKSWQTLQHLDVMIVAGSNQYLDNFGGTMGFPYTILKWTLLCRSRSAQVVFLSIGAGPIDSPVSRAMVRLAIRLGRFHSYRDEASLRLIEGDDARLGGVVYPDLASNLEFEETGLDFEAQNPVVAINPMPVYGDYWFVRDKEKYVSYLTKLAQLAIHIDARNCSIKLFPTQTSDMDAILDLVDIIRQQAPSCADKIEIIDNRSTQHVMKTIQSAHIIVPTRFHGAVLGVLAKRLVVGVCYQAKAMAVLDAADQGAYSFMLDEVTANDLTLAIDKLWLNKHDAHTRIVARSNTVRALIAEQYKIVLERLEG